MLRWLGLLLLTAGLVVLPAGSQAVPLPGSTSPTDRWGPSDLVLFWGDGCPHCEAEMAWLEEATDTYPDLTVHLFEVWYDEANRVLLEEVAAQMGFEVSGVPVTVMAGRHWIGWSEVVQGELTAHIEAQLDSGADVDTDGDTDGDTDQSVGGAGGEAVGGTTIEVPFFGEVTLGESLVASTIVIGFVDGNHACSHGGRPPRSDRACRSRRRDQTPLHHLLPRCQQADREIPVSVHRSAASFGVQQERSCIRSLRRV